MTVVGDVTVGKSLLDSSSSRSATEKNTEPETKKPASRPKKPLGGELCSAGTRLTDVDRLSEEKRREMRKKARAISRAISKKAEQSKPHSPATRIEHSHTASNSSATEKKSTNAKTDMKQHNSGKSRWRIPRVQNVQAITDSVEAAGDQLESRVSKVSPPLSRDAAGSSFGWHRPSHTAGDARKTSAKASQGPPTSPEIVHNTAKTAAAGSSALSPTVVKVPSVQRAEEKLDNRVSADLVAAVSKAVPVTTPRSSESLFSGRNSSQQSQLRTPSRAMIQKIELSSQQKLAILLPNVVPACGERGMAVGINIPSQRNISPATTQTLSHSSVGNRHNLPVAVSRPVPPPSSVAPSHTAASNKRKLNISQYKSILPQRRRTLLQTPADPPTVYVYGRCKDILHDHDYTTEVKPSTGCGREPSAEDTSVLPKSSGPVTAVKDETSETADHALATVDASPDNSRRLMTVSVNSNVADLTLQSGPSTSALSDALELQQDSVLKGGSHASACGVLDETVDRMPAYFDVVSLPNRQTKISVSTATLLTKKRHTTPHPVIVPGDSDLTQQSSDCSDSTLRHWNDVGRSIESHVPELTVTLLKWHSPQPITSVNDSDATRQSSEDNSINTLHRENKVCIGSHISQTAAVSLTEPNAQSGINNDDSISTRQSSEDNSDNTLHREINVCIGSHISESAAVSGINTDDSISTRQSSELCSASTLQCDNDVGRSTEDCVPEPTAASSKSHNQPSDVSTNASNLTRQSSKDLGDDTLHCGKNVDRSIESNVSVSQTRRVDTLVVTVDNRCASPSSSVLSAISVSSDDVASSRSRSSSRSRTSSETSYSSDSRSENFVTHCKLYFFSIFCCNC